MTRLYDRVRANLKNSGIYRYSHDWIEDAVVVDADDIIQYWLDHARDEPERVKGLPNAMPPLNRMFVEAQFPRGVPLKEFHITASESEDRIYAIGSMIEVAERDEFDDRMFREMWKDKQEEFAHFRSGIKWVLKLTLFAEFAKKQPYGPLDQVFLPLDEEGKYIDYNDEERIMSVRKPDQSKSLHGATHEAFGLDNIADITKDHLLSLSRDEVKRLRKIFLKHKVNLEHEITKVDAQRSYMLTGLYFIEPIMLAVSFMNCKNIELVAVDPLPKVSKKHMRKTGKPLVRHHVLQIEPMKRVVRHRREAEEPASRNALHLARGHFKTYTKDKPLFGKRVGTWWWQPHVRGSVEEGVVTKDYKIKSVG